MTTALRPLRSIPAATSAAVLEKPKGVLKRLTSDDTGSRLGIREKPRTSAGYSRPPPVPACPALDDSYCVARWQLPVLRHVAASEQVAGCPSTEQPQPNCEHQACWLRAIDLYTSELLVTRVPVVAHAESNAQSAIAANVPLWMLFTVCPFLIAASRGSERRRIEWTRLSRPRSTSHEAGRARMYRPACKGRRIVKPNADSFYLIGGPSKPVPAAKLVRNDM